jgi:predicted  nucleic acid-binding Zn-ribbon protein
MDQEFSSLESAITQLIKKNHSLTSETQHLALQNQNLNSKLEEALLRSNRLSEEKIRLEQQLETTALRIQTLLQSLPA